MVDEATAGTSPGGEGVRCSGCGDCCAVVALKGTKSAYQFVLTAFPEGSIDADQIANAKFIMNNMFEIDVNVAAKINARKAIQDPFAHFYLCAKFDAANKRCMAYDDRPPMCQNAPLYGFDPADPRIAVGLAPYPRCSFWRAVPRQNWPTYVTELTVTESPPGALSYPDAPRGTQTATAHLATFADWKQPRSVI